LDSNLKKTFAKYLKLLEPSGELMWNERITSPKFSHGFSLSVFSGYFGLSYSNPDANPWFHGHILF